MKHLEIVFHQLCRHQLKMNQPTKVRVRVTSGKFLESMVQHKGFEVDPAKIKVIIELQTPGNTQELKRL